MQTEPTIVFRGMEPSPMLRQRIEQRIQHLQRLHPHVLGCQVSVEPHALHGRQGHRFHVRVELSVPGHVLVVNREPIEHQAHEDAFVAVRDAFDAMERRVEDLARVQRGDVKTHQPQAHGRVEHIDHAAGRGSIAASDGRSIYFHRNSVVGDRFEFLEAGSEVRFVEQAGEEGPQASTVVPLGRHHPSP